MNSEVEKEHSGFEILREDDGYALPKFDGIEVLTDHKGSTESGQTAPLTNIVPGSMDSKNQTSLASDQIEVSEDEGTVRKGKISRGHSQQKKRFTCGVCGKSLSSKQNLQTHEFTHTGDKPFACRICGRSFAQSNDLSRHKLTHTGYKPFACNTCGKAFADRSVLAKHKICGKSFARSRCLSSHKLTHTGEKPFSYSVCGKAFNRQSNLRTHEFTHKKEKRFHCSVCGDGFRSKAGLHYHEKKHSEGNQSTFEKEHSGFEILREDDGYALPKFDGIEVLTDHKGSTESGQTAPLTNIVPGSMDNKNQTTLASDQIEVSEDKGTVRKGKNSRGHSQQKKRFTCGVCGKSSSTKRNLQTHEFTHTGEKPFACRICGKAFADGRAL
ncbi:unnamed protein product, partial [Cyprideis torosa]